MKSVFCLALFGWFASLALAQQESDLLSPYRLVTWQRDGRLARRVTIEVPGKPLREALAQLSRVSGVPLRVSRECAEWRAVLYVQETPIGDTLAGIAYAFDLSWRTYSTGEGKPPGYELYQSPLQKQRQDDLVWGRAQRLQDVLSQALPRAQRMLEQGARMPVPNLSYPTTRQQAIDRCVYKLLQESRLIPALSPLREAELARLFAGYPVYLTAERFTPIQRETLAPENATVYVQESPESEPQPQQITRKLAGVLWRFEAPLMLLTGTVIARSEEGAVNETSLELNLLDYGESTAIVQEDLAGDSALRSLTPQERQQRLPHERLPAAQGLTVPERLRRLAQMVPVNVIAEYYPLSMFAEWDAAGETAEQTLQVLAPYYRPKRWGNLLLFRSRRVALDRIGDVPQNLLDRWLGNQQAFGLTLNTVREVDTTLSHYQREAFTDWCSSLRSATARHSPARSLFLDRMFEAIAGEARLMVRLLSCLPLGQQSQVLAGAQVLLPDSPALRETLDELRLQTLSWGGVFDLPAETPLWLQGKRILRRFWAYDGASLDVEYYVRPENLWQSAPSESPSAFQKRLRQTRPQLDESRWLEVEEEQVTLKLGAGERTLKETLLTLVRYRRLPAGEGRGQGRQLSEERR